jgi:MSHA biogenesis protein MshK
MADGMMRNLFRTTLALTTVLFSVPATAEELPDPTRPPASLAAPVVVPADGAAAKQPAGLQSIIISKNRRAAIIGGETVELGGKYGDAKLIEVNEGNVVLRNAQDRQVLTLFPDVKITGKQEIKTKPQLPAGESQSGKRVSKPAVHQEKR